MREARNQGPCLVVRPADARSAALILAEPIPTHIASEPDLEPEDFNAPACPACGAPEPLLESADPTNHCTAKSASTVGPKKSLAQNPHFPEAFCVSSPRDASNKGRVLGSTLCDRAGGRGYPLPLAQNPASPPDQRGRSPPPCGSA